MATRSLRRSVLALAALLALAGNAVHAVEICDQVKTCRRNGNGVCDRSKEECPPCIFALEDGFTCWDKLDTTNTCPFTGVKYDCSTVWAAQTTTPAPSNSSSAAPSSSSNSTSTAAQASPEASSPIVMYAAIGGGVLLVLIIVLIIVLRRRRRGRNMPKFGDSPPGVYNTKHGAKNATANTPYTNAPNTSKGPYSYQRKFSDPPVLESSAVNMNAPNASDYSGNTTSDSLDAMLMDNTPPPAVLGDPLPRKRGLSKGFKRINSGGSSKRKSSTPDVTARCTNSANVLDEYLKMKHEMKYDADATSDYGSDTMSLDRFSMSSTSTAGGHNARAMSMTDSEYQADLMRSRTESECFSEMSYNDEKYSFSEEEPDIVLTASIVRKLSKEVEI